MAAIYEVGRAGRNEREERVFRERMDPWEEFSDQKFIARYRLNKVTACELADGLAASEWATTTHQSFAMPPHVQVCY